MLEFIVYFMLNIRGIMKRFGILLVVGTTSNTDGGLVYKEESDVWLDYLDEHMISWCN
jgi:hypothetical protein